MAITSVLLVQIEKLFDLLKAGKKLYLVCSAQFFLNGPI